MNTTTAAQRTNARQDKIWERAKAAKQKRQAEREDWTQWLKTYGAGKFYDAFMSIAQNAEGTCVHCDQPIYLDIREGGGIPDWRTLDGDYGCNNSPENDEDGCGGHLARKGNI